MGDVLSLRLSRVVFLCVFLLIKNISGVRVFFISTVSNTAMLLVPVDFVVR